MKESMRIEISLKSFSKTQRVIFLNATKKREKKQSYIGLLQQVHLVDI